MYFSKPAAFTSMCWLGITRQARLIQLGISPAAKLQHRIPPRPMRRYRFQTHSTSTVSRHILIAWTSVSLVIESVPNYSNRSAMTLASMPAAHCPYTAARSVTYCALRFVVTGRSSTRSVMTCFANATTSARIAPWSATVVGSGQRDAPHRKMNGGDMWSSKLAG